MSHLRNRSRGPGIRTPARATTSDTITAMTSRPHVGTLREKPLHAALKRWYAEDGDRIEVPVDGFVIDLVRDDVLIEIQTRGFSGMKSKLARLLEDHAVRLVHPVPAGKWIVRLGDGGEILSRRRSPKRGSAVDLFAELVSFPGLIAHPGLTLEVLLVHEEEILSLIHISEPTRPPSTYRMPSSA